MGQRTPQLVQRDELWVGRRNLGDPLTYWDAKNRDLATAVPHVDGAWHQLTDEMVREMAEVWTVRDNHGPIFTLRRYTAADDLSFDVIATDGAPLATFYVDAGLLHDEVVVRDAAAAPVGEIVTDDGVHELRELHGSTLAEARRVLERGGGDGTEQIWHVHIDSRGDTLFDRRVLAATPLVCLLTGHPKREWDPDSVLGVALLMAFPPAGMLVLAAERTLDGLYWLRRKLN
jgi:hypothetical protein